MHFSKGNLRRTKTCYEGITQVKELKISMLIFDYELFKIKDGEFIKEIYKRFTKIIGGLKTLGKNFQWTISEVNPPLFT